MIRNNAQQLKKKHTDEEIKNRLSNIKTSRKINIESLYMWVLLLANLIYIILLTINFLIISVGTNNTSKSNNDLGVHLMFYVMPILLNILFSLLVYFAQAKIKIGTFFIILWAAIWILAIVLPFIVSGSSLTVINIIGIFPLSSNVIILFILFYKLSKHRELLRIKYYQKKLSNL